jgi:Tfp pilus assembly protein FimT
MKRKIKSQVGVTIIELLITAVIVGIVAAMAVPRFQIAYDRIQFRSANRDLTSTYRLARSMAITDKAQYGVHLDNQAMTVTLFKDAATGAYAFSAGADTVIRVDTMPWQFHYMSTDVEGDVIFFRPNGTADFNGGGNIFTIADTEDLLGIYWNNALASTGRIHTESYYY